jgi:hypothetical protein
LLETTRPLRPHRDPDDATYNVNIDHTGSCFDRFEADVSVRAVRMDGALVLAYGETGSGKTTLLHRCAEGMRVRAAAMGSFPLIIDLSDREFTSQSTAARTQTLYHSVITFLQTKLRILEPERLAGLLHEVIPPGSAADHHLPANAYLRLSLLLDNLAEPEGGRPADVVLIVILPTFLELPAEVEFYRSQRAPRLLFLCETTYASPAPTGRVTLLPLGRINEADVWKVAEERLLKDGGVLCPPYTTQADVAAYFDNWGLGFATAQRILLQAFDDALQSHPSPDRLRFEHFSKALLHVLESDPSGRPT